MANLFTMLRAEPPAIAARPHVVGGVATAAAMLGLLAVFHATVASLLGIWTSSVIYGHGAVIPVIAAYLAHQRRVLVARAPVRPALALGGGALVLAGAIWLAGDATGTALLQHAGLVGMLQSTVLLVLGVRITLALAFPLAYLVLAIPFGDSLVPTLQDITAHYTTGLLRASGVPVYLADWKMITPDGAFLVARVCAGLQYILACLAIGGLIAGIWFRTPWKRLVVLAVAVAVPLGANVLRAYGIVMLAHLAGFEAAIGTAHVVYGFIFLSIISLGFILLAARFREAGVPAPGSAAHGAPAVPHRPLATLALAAALAVALAVGIKGSAGALTAPTPTGAPAELAAPDMPAAWQPIAGGDRVWTPEFRSPPAARRTWQITEGDRPVSLTLAAFDDTGANGDVIGGRLFAGPADDMQVTHRGRVPAARVPGQPAPAYLRLELPGEPARLVWYWYAVGDRLTSDPVTAKLYHLLARVQGASAHARLILLATPAGDGDTARLARLAAGLDLARLAAPSVSTPE